MVEFVIDFWALSFLIVGVTGFLILPRIATTLRTLSSKSQRKLQQLDNEYIEELEHKLKQYKNKAMNLERPPQIEGNMSELDSVLPELFGSFEQYAPRWLKPFLANKDTQKWLIDYASKNPEKVQNIIGKMVKQTGVQKGQNQEQSMSL